MAEPVKITAEQLQYQRGLKYSEGQSSLIKNTFANLDLLMAIRKVFFQFPITPLEASSIAGAMNPDTLAILKKAFNPDLDPESMLGQLADAWIGVDQAAGSRPIHELMPIFVSRELVINYIEQQLAELKAIAEKGKSAKREIIFKDLVDLKGKSSEDFYINLSARNKLLGFIDGSINELYAFAVEKVLTPAEIAERARMNSTK